MRRLCYGADHPTAGTVTMSEFPAEDIREKYKAFLRADLHEERSPALVLLNDYGGGLSGAGASLRQIGLVEGLRRSVATDVISVNAMRDRVACEQQCATCADRIMRTDRTLVPVPYNWYYCARVEVLLARVLEESSYSLVVLSHLWMSHYIPVVRGHSTATLLLDLHNAEADLREEMVSHPAADLLDVIGHKVDVTQLEHSEHEAIRAVDLVTVPSPQDRERLARRYRESTPIMVVPNAVPVWQDSRPSEPRVPRTAFFIGTLDYFPNTQAAVKIFADIGPAIITAVPGLRVMVAGRRPPLLLRQLAQDSEVGFVSDLADVRPIFRDSVLVVPLEVGGGTRLKILEAFSAGCSVVSTAKGMEGIDAVPDVHYVPAEDSEGFAAAVAAVVADSESDLRRRQAAWELVVNRYSWEAAARSVAEVVRSGFDPLVTAPTPPGRGNAGHEA